jgi:Cof subfamily protein (haloacid dehalogenase superfamily)
MKKTLRKKKAGNSMNRLYISDLDMTLLQENAILSEFSRRGIDLLYDEGILFTVATARSVYSIVQILGDIRLHLPVIEINGSYISDLKTGKHFHVEGIDTDLVDPLWDLGKKHRVIPFLSTSNGEGDRLYHPEPENEGIGWYLRERQKNRDKRLHELKNFADVRNETFVCFTYIAEKSCLDSLVETLRTSYMDRISLHYYENPYQPGYYWLNVHSIRATKAQAVRKLAEDTGLSNHEITVFGDQINDVSMVKSADRGIAVENAIDEVKSHADVIIGPNREDSVIRFILEENGLSLPSRGMK